MSKLGRPTEDPAVNRIALRLTGMDIQKLNECSNILELNKTDVIRRGIDELYKKIKKGEWIMDNIEMLTEKYIKERCVTFEGKPAEVEDLFNDGTAQEIREVIEAGGELFEYYDDLVSKSVALDFSNNSINEKMMEIYGCGYSISVKGKLVDGFINPLVDLPVVTLTGVMYGNDECFDGDDFYQVLVADNGKMYHCYYDYTGVELDCIDYSKPARIKEYTE